MLELLKRYVSLKQGVRHNTRMGYRFVLNLVAKEEFGSRKICTVKVSDAKLWFLKLYQDGKGYSTHAHPKSQKIFPLHLFGIEKPKRNLFIQKY